MQTKVRLLLTALVLALEWAGPAPAAEPAGVSIQVNKGSVDFMAGKDLVARYNTFNVVKPYFWPLHGPGGVPMTRAWPMVRFPIEGSRDKNFEKSFWFGHGDIIPQGIPYEKIERVKGVDFWSEVKPFGWIVCTEVGKPNIDKDHCWLRTRNEWRAPPTKLLDETRTIHLYNFGATRLLVLDIDLHASVAPITFADTRDGSLGVRVNDALSVVTGKGKITTADGKVGDKACWGQQSAWCDYSGSINGKAVGLALFDDPSNPYRACWNVTATGLMAANPFGRAASEFPAVKDDKIPVRLAKGEHLKLRYGLLIHPGDAKSGKVADYFEEFVKLKG